jgi:hypothetical protein
LHAYIGGIIRNRKGELLAAGGIPDHIHLLVRLPADKAVSDVVGRSSPCRVVGFTMSGVSGRSRGRVVMGPSLSVLLQSLLSPLRTCPEISVTTFFVWFVV